MKMIIQVAAWEFVVFYQRTTFIDSGVILESWDGRWVIARETCYGEGKDWRKICSSSRLLLLMKQDQLLECLRVSLAPSIFVLNIAEDMTLDTAK